MNLTRIESAEHPALLPYTRLTDSQLRSDNTIIVESPKVILTAMEQGLEPVSLLCEEKHLSGDAEPILKRYPGLQVFTGKRELLASITGYTLTRGVLCAMKRPQQMSPEEILASARRICVIYDVCDTTNIGVIFRTAAALGFDGVMLSPQTCSPLNRRAIRVSMGAVFQIPWCVSSEIFRLLQDNGVESVALALTSRSVSITSFKMEKEGKYALFLGSEGYGLPQDVIESCDQSVIIPMKRGVDSLNVGAAAAIAMWHFALKQ